MKQYTFHPGGIKLQASKLSAGTSIIHTDLPLKVTISMRQHQGRPSKPIVKVGDHVKRFQMIAEANGLVSANIHSPITGTVKAIGSVQDAYGYYVDAIVISATEEQHFADMASVPERTLSDDGISKLTSCEIREIASRYGIVGMGGATFPTDVKLSIPQGKSANVVIINGAECEPYLTCDHSLMLSAPEEIILGADIARKACGAAHAIIGIEANKPDAIKKLSSNIPAGIPVEVACLKERYPQGGEKQLVMALTGRRIKSGMLPIDVGTVVLNVATVHALWRAAAFSEPLVSRIVTLTGPEMPNPANYHTCIGHDISELLELSGASVGQGSKLIIGGPMMGRAVINQNATVEKGTSGILLFPSHMALRQAPEACIRCARCVEACPMGLEPYLISTLCRLGKTDRAIKESLTDCIECGCCSYICPSKRPLLDFIRLGKETCRSKRQNQSKQ